MISVKVAVNTNCVCSLVARETDEVNDDGEVQYEVFQLLGNPTRLSDDTKISEVWHNGGVNSLVPKIVQEGKYANV